jgi:uncharacterized protein (TIGR00255 family)
MTGFAFAKTQIDGTQSSVEIKSYNNRFLEIYCNLPPSLSILEPRIRSIISEKFLRGKIEISIKTNKKNSSLKINVNEAAVKAYSQAIKKIQSLLQDEKGSVEWAGCGKIEKFLQLEGVLELDSENEIQGDATGYTEESWNLIEKPFLKTLADFEEERAREGEHTKKNILSHLQKLENSLQRINAQLPQIEASIKDNLKKRFQELCNDKIDETRMYGEIAVLLMKWTIAEEISRLQAHFFEFNAEILSSGAQGKKLDFLCQEINREINTIGSKTPLIEVSKEVVQMKDTLENIREQLRNIE